MKVIEGRTFEWKGRMPTTRLTERALTSVKPMSITEGLATVTEKIIGTNNLRSVAVLDKMIQISRSVVHITIPGMGVATGFMIRPDVLMTNNHVFGSADDAKDAIIRFNYQIDLSGNFLPTDDYRCDVSFFHTDALLDYSIVKVKGTPGLKWGYILISRKIITMSPARSSAFPEFPFVVLSPLSGYARISRNNVLWLTFPLP